MFMFIKRYLYQRCSRVRVRGIVLMMELRLSRIEGFGCLNIDPAKIRTEPRKAAGTAQLHNLQHI